MTGRNCRERVFFMSGVVASRDWRVWIDCNPNADSNQQLGRHSRARFSTVVNKTG
jgi:hypothetical protein